MKWNGCEKEEAGKPLEASSGGDVWYFLFAKTQFFTLKYILRNILVSLSYSLTIFSMNII